ncbi:hypothetical protein [Furfurilactobacillus siliginis]|uniref:Uncharacterized protein n=1 Tax=Furfurilactobacillus siliginis TaxID=348151 RepID=A0A0R2L4B9_9LACO|nr:hypothetical protein [Furfurilactobacillus siliginis]KRN94106.1 hypothetical protein IV55_GL000619 [Furfurilactobacillus siliginis]GEK29090.1 hypothetical protein LSI01_14010 [Furfurilactobacillus siliginis]
MKVVQIAPKLIEQRINDEENFTRNVTIGNDVGADRNVLFKSGISVDKLYLIEHVSVIALDIAECV